MKDKENGRVNLPFFLDILSFRSSCPRFPWIMCITLTYPFTIVHVCCSGSPKILCLEHDVHNLRRAYIFLQDRIDIRGSSVRNAVLLTLKGANKYWVEITHNEIVHCFRLLFNTLLKPKKHISFNFQLSFTTLSDLLYFNFQAH